MDPRGWLRLERLFQRARRRFRLPTAILQPLTNPRATRWGDCDHPDPMLDRHRARVVRLRMHVLRQPHRALKPTTVLWTLAHELAHLRHTEHSREHRELARSILGWINDHG